MTFSDYIVYVDESGDHGMERIDSGYPIFVLSFCVFKKSDYIATVVPALQTIKFRYWGHDAIILHEHDLRNNRSNDFSLLLNAATRESLMEILNATIESLPFHVISTVLRKESHRNRYATPEHPYHLSLEFCLERLKLFLEAQGVDVASNTTHLMFESRGKEEDDELELAFRRIMDRALFKNALFEMRFISKKANCSGIQLADLVARPIGLHVLRPEQKNRAFDIIRSKLFTKHGKYLGYGLKVFP